MRIAIDARLNAYRQGGISQYTRQLLTALPTIERDDEFVALQHRDQLRPLAIAPNVARRTALTPPHHRFEQWSLPIELLLARPSVAHFPDFIAPVRRPCPAVVTIHDLAFMHYPEILDDAARAYYGQVKTNAPRAEGIIAVSEATRQDIAQFIDIPIEQIDVIYEAAAPLFQQIALRPGEARVLNSTPVEAGSFLLFVSTLEPRKNLPTLLQALRICVDRRPAADYRLVIVGRRGWRDEAIFTTVRDLKLGEHVLFAGGVGQYDLRWLYNACRIYINPSLYEGFGLPLLEAMACGAPCLAAATSSLPEIGGSAAVYVPPLDADVWADEIEVLWDDEERRAELSRMGLVRAQQFSWGRAARETLAVYRRAAEGRTLQTPAPVAATLPLGDVLTPARVAALPGGPRACVQCGAELKPGTLQHHLALRPAEQSDEPRAVLAPRAWACPHCGHVELVIDWAAAAYAPSSGEPVAEAARATADAAAYAISTEEDDVPAEVYADVVEAQPALAEIDAERAEADSAEVAAEAQMARGEANADEAEAHSREIAAGAAAADADSAEEALPSAAAELAAEVEVALAETELAPAQVYDPATQAGAVLAERFSEPANANGVYSEADAEPAHAVLVEDGRPDREAPSEMLPTLVLPDTAALERGATPLPNGKHTDAVASTKVATRAPRRTGEAAPTSTKRRQSKPKRK